MKKSYANICVAIFKCLVNQLHSLHFIKYNGKCSFIFQTTNDLNKGQFNKPHGLRETKNQQTNYDKLTPQFSH